MTEYGEGLHWDGQTIRARTMGEFGEDAPQGQHWRHGKRCRLCGGDCSDQSEVCSQCANRWREMRRKAKAQARRLVELARERAGAGGE